MKGGKPYGGGKNGGGVLGEPVWVARGNMGKGNGNRPGEGNPCPGRQPGGGIGGNPMGG